MSPEIALLVRVSAAVLAFAVFAFVMVRLVRNAKKGGGGLPALGAAMMVFGFGAPRDPVDEVVEQVEKLKKTDREAAGDQEIS